jgi:hypothetical protein
VETEFSQSFFRASLMFPNFLLHTEKESLSTFDKREALPLLPEIAKETENRLKTL